MHLEFEHGGSAITFRVEFRNEARALDRQFHAKADVPDVDIAVFGTIECVKLDKTLQTAKQNPRAPGG